MSFGGNGYFMTAAVPVLIMLTVSHWLSPPDGRGVHASATTHLDMKKDLQPHVLQQMRRSHLDRIERLIDSGAQMGADSVDDSLAIRGTGYLYASKSEENSLVGHKQDDSDNHAHLFSRRIPTALSASMIIDVKSSKGVGRAAPDLRYAVTKADGDMRGHGNDHVDKISLREAAKSCRTDMAREILASGADVNEVDRQGRTALHFAASLARLGGRNFLPEGEPLALISTLLNAGADVNKRDRAGRSALHYVATQSGPDVVKAMNLLLAAGADVEAQDNIGNTPLHRACVYRRQETVKLLLSKGASVNTRSRSGFTPLISAMAFEFTLGLSYREKDGTMLETVKILVNAGADVNARTERGMTALKIALLRKATEVVKLLKAYGARK